MAECLAWPRRHSDACSLQGYRYGRKFSSAKCATVCVLQPPTSNAVLFTDPVGIRPSQVPRKWRYRRMAIRKALSSPLGRLTRVPLKWPPVADSSARASRSEEHTSELQSLRHLVCR